MLKVVNLGKRRQDGDEVRSILTHLNLQVAAGESVSITGASGSGKSTLLHILASLEPADSGQIEVDGESLLGLSESEANRFRSQRLGIVFQQFNLVSCLTVEQNIAFPARLKDNFDQDYLLELSQQLGVTHLLCKLPHQLSGGEQQRVAVARALAHKPDLILADEPTGNLDGSNSVKVANLLLQVTRHYHTALVMVTHSDTIAALTDRQLVMVNGALETRHQPQTVGQN